MDILIYSFRFLGIFRPQTFLPLRFILRSVTIASFPISLFQQFCKLFLPSIMNDWGPFFVHLENLKLISGCGARLGIVKIKYRPLTKQISITLVPNLDICDPIKNEIDFLSNDYKKKYVSFFFSFDIENLLEDFFDPDSSHNLIDFHIVSDSDSPLSAELDSFVFSSPPSIPPVSPILPFLFLSISHSTPPLCFPFHISPSLLLPSSLIFPILLTSVPPFIPILPPLLLCLPLSFLPPFLYPSFSPYLLLLSSFPLSPLPSP